MKKLYALTVVMLAITITSFSQTWDGGAGTSNWSDANNWNPNGVPAANADVTIPSGYNVVVSTNTSCNSITFSIVTGSLSGGSLTVNEGIVLTVSGGITKQNATQTSSTTTLAGAGTINCASLTVGGTTTGLNGDHTITLVSTITALNISGNLNLNGEDDGSDNQHCVFNLGAGTVTVDGSVVTDEESGSSVTLDLDTGAETGTLVLTGATPFNDLVGTPTLDLDGSSATVNYAGAAQSIRNTTYNNLTASGTDTKTLSGDVTLLGNLLVEAGTSVLLGSSDITISANADRTATINGTLTIDGNGRLQESNGGTKTLAIGAGGLLRITDNGGTGLPLMNAYDFDANSTVEFGSTDNQTIENSVTYGNLTTSGSGTKTLETAGGTMTFQGTITIGSGTTLASNNKTMNVGGNWNNSGSFTQGTSTVNLIGMAAQSVGGSVSTTFNNLTINNSSTGVTLNQALTVTGVMTFTDGIVFSLFPNIVTINDNATVAGASDASFVDGPVTKIGDDAFRFPVGSVSNGYHFCEITAPSDPTHGFSAQYVRSSGSALGPITAVGLYGVSNCEYWNIYRIAGNSEPGVILSWSASSPCGGTYITNLIGMQVATFDGTSWNTTGGSGSTGTTTEGTVSRNTVSGSIWGTSNTFTLGNALAGGSPLPVKLSSINAFEKQAGIQVDWTAYQEDNLSHYQVERSADGVNFTAIGNVSAQNAIYETRYGFYDANPLPGVNFYRLKNIDFDGKSGYSNIVKVNLDKTVKDIVLYPNPVRNGYVAIQSSELAKGQYAVRIFNAAGQQVYAKSFSHTGGAVNQTIQLPVNSQSGLYTLLLENGAEKIMAKSFIVQ